MTMDAQRALGHLPQGLRDELVTEYGEIVKSYREGRWKTTELDAGWFCEIVYTILAAYLDGGHYPARASKPGDLISACEKLKTTPKESGPDSARFTIPRILIGLYQVRSQRGVAHVGGVVDANHMDATYVLHACQWVMAEMVRMFHDTDVKTATAIVDTLVDRTLPVVWRVGDLRRLLDTGLSDRDSVLLLLYSEPKGLPDRQLAAFMEKRLDNLRTRVLRPLHTDRFIEYKNPGDAAVISPKGERYLEDNLLPKLAS
ncbi:MAG TPA: hypothetical protein VFJ19_16135 [Nocardioidaceae bacterium]|nr:hypothetical protein [Nocardioidaceae bacterium]